MEPDSDSQVTTASSRLAGTARKLLSFNIRKIRMQVEAPGHEISLAERLNARLYEKYCSSQNFYYTKEIDNILCGVKSAGSIRFQEEASFAVELERGEEMLKRYYRRAEYSKKIKLLSEYYKFHEDVPRLAMLPLSSLVHNFHDQKRRINYIKITKMLNNGKIDSELVRNMDPNEDSELSQCTVASSLLSFLPEEFKRPGSAQSARKKAASADKRRALEAKGLGLKFWGSRNRSRERKAKPRHSFKQPKNRERKARGNKQRAQGLSPISGRKGQFYLEKPAKRAKGRRRERR